jgi:ATP-binding cassette subfamily C protein CydC
MKSLAGVIRIMLMEKKDIVLSIFFGFIAGITAVGLFSASGYLISKAALTPPIYMLMVVVSVVKLLGIVSAASRYGERYFSHRGTFTMLSNVRVAFYERLEPLAPKIFHRFKSGDLLSRIVGDVETLQNFFLRVFYPPVVLFLVFLTTILFTAFFSVHVAVILLIGYFLTTFVVPALFTVRQRKINTSVREKRGALSTDVTEFLYGFRDLKIYQKLTAKERELEQTSYSYIEEQGKNNIHQLFSESVNTLVSLFVSWTVLAVAGYLTAEGQLDGLFLTMFMMISLTVFENTSPMAAFSDHYEDSRQAAQRLRDVVEEEPEETGHQKQKTYTQAPAIELREVNFSYPGDAAETLKDVSITFPAGSKTAIIGASGSGKSTIMQLLLKVYSHQGGELFMDGDPYETIHEETIWKHVNAVLQSNHFFFGTLRDNLMLAKEDASDEELKEVLKKVNLSAMSLEEPVLEKGENLSGGEKQRLAIARTMLKDAPIWLLDEPTSSLDALTEKQVHEHLFEQAKDDTVIWISHKLIGMEQMDQIIVMDNGKIVEQGNYEALMEKGGYFAKMKEIEKNMFGA